MTPETGHRCVPWGKDSTAPSISKDNYAAKLKKKLDKQPSRTPRRSLGSTRRCITRYAIPCSRLVTRYSSRM
ncbi:hypothetical protein DPMN_171700 [Dreissena polymorpha]|uniref:Uncharacterized protein n=1 Tax=Dreissena polymorpha TaxID=45954 RepID=A0A9D4E070_DREPO|nr:hypothetical protein DPMN_171700 [Dreissena polymorpha]